MNYFKVTFEDGNVIQTGMNATIQEADAYYIGKYFNFGDTYDCTQDKMVKAVKIEELK